MNPHPNSAQCEAMKNKRLVHGKIIENFQEKSQQAEVLRHDLIDTMGVRTMINFKLKLTFNRHILTLNELVVSITADSFTEIE